MRALRLLFTALIAMVAFLAAITVFFAKTSRLFRGNAKSGQSPRPQPHRQKVAGEGEVIDVEATVVTTEPVER